MAARGPTMRRPFDDCGVSCENLRAMKLVRTLLALALAVSAATATGCSKSSDTGHLEHEATALVKQYDQKLARLEERRLALEGRSKNYAGLGKEHAGKVGSDFDAATKRLAELRERTKRLPAELAAFAKGSAARVSLIAKTGDIKRELGDGVTVVTTAFDIYENYLARIERGEMVAQKDEPAAPPPAQDPPPPAPEAAGSSSPPTPSGDTPPSSSTQGGPAPKAPAGGH